VDQINDEDRLDRLGVKGRQNKKVGIREVKRTSHETVFRGGLAGVAKKLGVDEKAHYKAEGKKTQCSQFVRNYAKEFLARSIPELDGQAGDQFDKLIDFLCMIHHPRLSSRFFPSHAGDRGI
jgi:hypothetical protein